MEEGRSAFKMLPGKPTENRPLGKDTRECGIEPPGSISHGVN